MAMDSSQVIPEVPLSWKSVSRLRALASLKRAQIRSRAVSVHSMGLALMAH